MNRGNFYVSLAILGLLVAERGYGYSHNYVNDSRSTQINHIFVSQSVEAEYGPAVTTYVPLDDKSTQPVVPNKQTWRGTGFNTTLGLEILKFVQFNAGHTFVNLRNNKSNLERLSGSRVHGGARLVFAAPVINLEMGGGFLASRYDYNLELLSADTYGSGYYYQIGGNYFITSQISFFISVKMISEHVIKSGGSAQLDQIDLSTTNVGAGFSIWL